MGDDLRWHKEHMLKAYSYSLKGINSAPNSNSRDLLSSALFKVILLLYKGYSTLPIFQNVHLPVWIPGFSPLPGLLHSLQFLICNVTKALFSSSRTVRKYTSTNRLSILVSPWKLIFLVGNSLPQVLKVPHFWWESQEPMNIHKNDFYFAGAASHSQNLALFKEAIIIIIILPKASILHVQTSLWYWNLSSGRDLVSCNFMLSTCNEMYQSQHKKIQQSRSPIQLQSVKSHINYSFMKTEHSRV